MPGNKTCLISQGEQRKDLSDNGDELTKGITVRINTYRSEAGLLLLQEHSKTQITALQKYHTATVYKENTSLSVQINSLREGITLVILQVMLCLRLSHLI